MYRKVFFIFIALNLFIFTPLEILPKQRCIAEFLTGFTCLSSGYLSEKEQREDVIYLTLEQISELALKNNFDIQLARFDAQFKQADLDKAESIYDTLIEAETEFKDDQTKSASSLAATKSKSREFNFGLSQKLPTGTTVELDFDNQRSWTNSSYTTVNPAHESSAKLSLKQELGKNFFGIKDRSNVKITKIDIENAQYTSLDKIEKMLGRVQESYWKTAQCLEAVRIRKEMLQQAAELFRINKEKREKGIIERPQLLASEANLKQKEIELILAENELQFNINELKFLLNLEDKDKIILPQDELTLQEEPKKLNSALKTAFSFRRDYLKAKNEVDSKDLKLVMKRNNLWPEVNLEASFTRNGLDDHFQQAIEAISSEDNPEYFLGLKISFPLQNRQARAEFNKAKIEKATALLKLKKIERRILIEIKDSIRNCNILQERAKKQAAVVELQQEKLNDELKRYKYGRSDTDTLIQYQDDLLLSRLLYLEALLDYKEALIELSLRENSLFERYWEQNL